MAAQTVMPMESDSVDDDEASTTDDVDSSRQWTTDDLEAGDSDAPTSGGKTTSNDEAEREDNAICRKCNSLTPEQDAHHSKDATRHHNRHHNHRHSKEHRRKRSNVNAAEEGEQGEDKKAQSDTETKNLLGDVDFDDDYPDTDLVGGAVAAPGAENDPKVFEPTEEQTRYYTSCFLHLMEKSQGVASPTGALNGADPCILEFFRKSGLDNVALSRIWALSDVNEDGFLNHIEFCTAMHLIVLHLKAKVPIPSELPPRIRPPPTPIRQLVPLSNGRYCASVVAMCSDGTTSTSASSSTHTAAAAPDTIGIASENTSNSRGSNNSNAQLNSWSFVNGMGQLAETFALSNSSNNNNQPQFTPHAGPMPTPRGECAAVAPIPSTKHHSLSDDHLHIYAAAQSNGEQPGGAALVTQFSNIPPLLVDSQPMALNANDALASLHTSMITRGPPPQPPFRAYHQQQSAGSTEGKGHGRSASLDLKTFVSLSSYPRKSPHLTNPIVFPIAVHPCALSTTPNSRNRLDSGHSHACPTAERHGFETKSTQTESDCAPILKCNSESSDCADMFNSSTGVPSLQERCAVLKRLNEQLENERATLAQVRLQLQIRIDEMQAQLAALKTSAKVVQTGDGGMTPGQNLNKPTAI